MENKKTTARAAKNNAQNDRNNDPSAQLAKALSGAKGAKSDAKKKAKGTASNGTSKPFSAGGKTVFLRMPNENVNPISIANSKIYDHDSRDIIEPARNVRSYSLFGDVYATLDELIKDYAFIPFPYQKENVKILLNNCDGRGVLGDQVGLGKTVEALMATHVMFKSGTIRNALIVAPHKAADGWAEEIEKKFKGIFYFDKNALRHGSTHGRDPFYETLKRIDADNNAKGGSSATSPYRVYIVTDKMLKDAVAEINIARENDKNIKDFNNTKINADTAEKLKNIERDILNEEMCGIDNIRFCYKFFDILTDHGYQGRKITDTAVANEANPDKEKEEYEYNTGNAGILVNCALTRYVCNEMLRILGKLLENYEYFNDIRRRNDPGRKKRIEDVKNVIEYFESVIDTMKKKTETYERCQSVYNKLLDEEGNRLVDLLIVDEIHSFYNDDCLNDQYDDELRNCVRLLARINKKFCILISATPLRTNLQNVFDLIYIADKARLGALLTSKSCNDNEAAETEEFENAKKYFYNVICHTDDDEHSLIKMFFADESLKRIKQDSIRDFFGLIDNFFTRSRIKDVHSMMHGDKRSEKAMRLIESKKSEIIDQRALIYQQEDYKPDKAQDEAVKGYDKWKANPDNDRSMNSAIDTVLIKAIKNAERNSKNIDEQRELYSMVDWSRGEKVGIALDVVGMRGIDVDSNYEDILYQSAHGIVPCLDELKDILYNQQDALTRVAKYLIWESDSTLAAGLKAGKARDLIYDYENDLCYNTVLCYADKRDDTLKILGERFRDGCHSIDHESGGRRVKVSPTISDVIDRTNHNQIAVINQDYQAGVNLQQYKTFVFTKMDWRGERLLEPIDIEQFIGRIHRTGQVKNCRIVTLLSTYMKKREYNPEVGFLKWYYKVLSDAKGFDLYGNSTPDVAFIQPIVVDGLRWKFGSIVSKLTLNKLIKTLQRIRDLNGDDAVDLHSEIVSLNQIKVSEVSRIINEFSFPQLLEFAYYYDQEAGNDDLKNSVTDLIYKLCEIEGFGKDHRRVYG